MSHGESSRGAGLCFFRTKAYSFIFIINKYFHFLRRKVFEDAFVLDVSNT